MYSYLSYPREDPKGVTDPPPARGDGGLSRGRSPRARARNARPNVDRTPIAGLTLVTSAIASHRARSPPSPAMLRLALLATLVAAACGLRRGGGAHDLASALQSGQPYRQRLENYHELIYHGSIEFGGQVVQAVFDTGSFDVVVTSQRCAKCAFTPYHSNASKTYRRDPHGYTEEHKQYVNTEINSKR